MSQKALTYSRREWVIELLILLAQGLLVWMVADLLLAPFTSNPDSLSQWLPIGLVFLAGLLPRLLHDYGIWNRSFSLVVGVAILLSTLTTIKVLSFPVYPWLDTTWLREAAHSLVFEQSTADIAVWAPIGLSAAVWWLARFNGSPGLERCRSMLMAAAAVCALVAIAGHVVEAGPSERALSVAIVVTFASILIALAIARQGSDATQSRRRLLSTVLAPTVAIVAIAAMLALLATVDTFRSTSASLAFLDTVLEPFFQLLVLVVTGLVIVISWPIVWLLSLGDYQGIPQFTGFGTNGENEQSSSALEWQPPDPLRYLLAALVLLAIFYGLTRFGLALVSRDIDAQETGDRAIGSRTGFGSWLDRFRGRFGRTIARDPLAALRNDPVWAHTVTIRDTYADWLRFAEQRQLARTPGETADELDHRAGPNLQTSSATAALDELTAIYDNVRYSAVPATPDQAERALRAWNTLKTAESAVASN